MISLENAYLFSILGIFPLYLSIFLLRKDIRHKMFSLSMFGAIAGPVSQHWYLQDYWGPTYTLGPFWFVEDLLFSFFVFGLSGGIINILLKVKSADTGEFSDKWSRVLITITLLIGILFLLTSLGRLNSIYASSIGFVILGLFIWYQRPDLIKPSLIGMTFWIFLTAVGYKILLVFQPAFIQNFWFWQNISRIIIWGIPVEEFLWFGTWGLTGSIFYEWKKGYRLVPFFK